MSQNIGFTNDDPIAQTFRVLRDHAPDADGLYCSGFDLFFATKSSTTGCTVDLRTVENGYPTRVILPFTQTYLSSSQINTSSNGTVPTRVTFKGPVYLKVGESYAITIKPDGNEPDLTVWVAINGRDDVVAGAPIGQNWGAGAFFSSASDAFLPKFDRDLKFNIYKAKFNTNVTGEINLTNADYEFLTVNNYSGTWRTNEEIYKVPGSFNTGYITITAGSSNVTGVSTTFSSDYSAGDTIVIRNNANTEQADVVTIESITSDTAMVLTGAAKISVANGAGALTPTAIVQSYNTDTGVLILEESTTQNTSHRFVASDYIKGCDSAANASIISVDNKVMSYFQPHLYRTAVNQTTVSANVNYSSSSNINSKNNRSIIFGINNNIKDREAAIYSKSNEANSSGIAKSLTLNVKMKTSNPALTPTFDTSTTSLQTYKYEISANNTNERTAFLGHANTKYISKTVTLASGMEAEDLNVYLTGYKPANTNIEVYARLTNIADIDRPSQQAWTKLVETDRQATTYSSSNNARDLKEFAYTVPLSPTMDATTKQTGTANTTAGSNVVSIASASTYYQADDIIIVSNGLRNDYALGRVSSANSTAVVLYDDLETGKTFTNASHYKVPADEKRSAFRYPLSSGNKLIYFDSSGREYNNFNFFQVKVLLLADQTNIVPRLSDVRAIALTG